MTVGNTPRGCRQPDDSAGDDEPVASTAPAVRGARSPVPGGRKFPE